MIDTINHPKLGDIDPKAKPTVNPITTWVISVQEDKIDG
jgi:hypothetical protein